MKFNKYSNLENVDTSLLDAGDVVMIRKGSSPYYWEQYKLTSDGELAFVRGVTDEQYNRLEQITQSLINKLSEDYSKQQIDIIVENLEQEIVDAVVQSSATYVPLNSDGSLPTPVTDNNFTILGDGDYGSIPADKGNMRIATWDGSVWTVASTVAMPETTGVDVIDPDGEALPKEKAVAEYVAPIDDKINKVVSSDWADPVLHQDVSSSAVVYGSAVDAYGWSFAMKARQNISKIFLKIQTKSPSVHQRVIVRENDHLGTILVDKSFTKSLNSLVVADFDFIDNPILNPRLTKLWVEVYMDAPYMIYRVTPAVVFTAEAGYGGVRYSTVNDMGTTQVYSGAIYNDIYHEVVTVSWETEDFTVWAKEKIAEISNENLVLPVNVQDAIDVVDTHFKTEWQENGEFELFTDGVGPQGTGGYKVGVPIGKREAFDKLTFGIYFLADGSRVRPTKMLVTLRLENKEGEVVSVSKESTFPPTGGTGRYNVEFNFSKPVASDQRLYAIISADGQFGTYRRYPGDTVYFTQAAGYPPYAVALIQNSDVEDTSLYYDFWFKTNVLQPITKLVDVQIDGLTEVENSILPNENERISFTGSSVTWGDGYLQSGYVAEYIKWKQSKVATAVLASSFSNGTILTNRKYFLGQALRLDGVGASIEFKLTGNEVSIIQSMRRDNDSASEIEVYIDNELYDTFNNFNDAAIGSDTMAFVGDGVNTMFSLLRPFTYGHSVTVNGVAQVVTHNSSQGTGFSIPANSDCAIIRGTGIGLDGKPSVVHWLWFKNPPAAGANISVSFNFGETIFYEKTTIGQLANNANECPYGDGTTSFDPTQPSAIGTGLDFRQTDDRAVKTYRFLENKERTVRIEIKGNYGDATGTPYFIFNFATNRYFHFQNAGIGGWDLWDLDRTISQDYLRGWQRVAEFNPDKLVIETTPNDDWIVQGHKVYTEKTGISLAELRAIRNLPLRAIQYDSGNDTYTISRWRGTITAITETSVTFDGVVNTALAVGDIIMIGQYWSNNRDYIERKVSAVNGNTLEFLEPINGSVYGSIDGLIGKEIGVRSYASFKNKLEGVIDNLRELLDCPIYILENPMPNVLARELWGYPIVMKEVANAKREVFTINYDSLRKWQSSQPVASVNINVADAAIDPYLGLRVIDFGSNGENLIYTDVLIDGESVYGSRAVVQNGWAYVVNQTATGAALNKSAYHTVNAGQVFNGVRPRLVLLDETLTSGTVEVMYTLHKWSGDSCHMNSNSSKLYADFLKII